MNASFNRWMLANAYGAFGTVTKERIEIVVEGTTDEDPDAATWHEYGFKGKPGEVHRIPRWFAPYHLRLDWLMWFLPLGRSLDDWFTAFLVKLLEADRATLRLLAARPVRRRAAGLGAGGVVPLPLHDPRAAAGGSRPLDPRPAARGARAAPPARVTACEQWEHEASRRRPRGRAGRVPR